ncbi:hypothetical protein [Arthrobacter sp. MMS18-M83]|uniref:hypothetical protein n=1 Tax=Arthrobacter sp. MMS18-M83 TaxID=2996261 RepID=UPI00227D0D0D|nr:hypothetical protein [Arthrobacter sp. MMS18-M83]WAH97038.1 hypothetical protein OW521_22225 [Arthrobacter sp. MMS18-M83]
MLVAKGENTTGVDVSREGSDCTVFSPDICDTPADLYEPDVDRTNAAPISHLVADDASPGATDPPQGLLTASLST